MSKTYKIHPVAALFPMLDDEQMQALAADIKANGLRDAIVVCGDEIIDGRNRLKACGIAGIEPRYREECPKDIVAYIVSTNVHRRHLTTQQRAAIAAELATLEHGGDRKSEKIKGSNDPLNEGLTLEHAATLMNVSRPSVVRAKSTMKNDPEAHEKAKAGVKAPRKPKQPKTSKYRPIDVAYEEGVLSSRLYGGSWRKLRDDLVQNYPDLDYENPEHEPQLRLACKEILARRDPDAAEKKVEEIKESLTKPQRESFEKKFDSAVAYRAHQHIEERVEKTLAERQAELDAKERELNEWAAALQAQQADITVYMTEQEYKLVLGCLHPDRAGDDDMLRKRLDKAFNIFHRLEVYIRKYPKSVLRERGWA